MTTDVVTVRKDKNEKKYLTFHHQTLIQQLKWKYNLSDESLFKTKFICEIKRLENKKGRKQNNYLNGYLFIAVAKALQDLGYMVPVGEKGMREYGKRYLFTREEIGLFETYTNPYTGESFLVIESLKNISKKEAHHIIDFTLNVLSIEMGFHFISPNEYLNMQTSHK